MFTMDQSVILLATIAMANGHVLSAKSQLETSKGDLIWCCGIMKAYPDFFPLETWGSLLGDKNRYIRREWDEKHCNDLVGSSKGENCKDRTDRSLDGCNTLREEVEMLKEANRNLTAKLEQLEPQIAAKSVIESVTTPTTTDETATIMDETTISAVNTTKETIFYSVGDSPTSTKAPQSNTTVRTTTLLTSTLFTPFPLKTKEIVTTPEPTTTTTMMNETTISTENITKEITPSVGDSPTTSKTPESNTTVRTTTLRTTTLFTPFPLNTKEIVTTTETTTEDETPTTTENITDTPSIPINPEDPIKLVDVSTTSKPTSLNATVKTTTPISTTLKSEEIQNPEGSGDN